jgi:hypothetical protein
MSVSPSWNTALRYAALAAAAGAFVCVTLAFVGVVLAFTGDPGECKAGDGPIVYDRDAADSFEVQWRDMDDTLGEGRRTSIRLNENEVTSRADIYLRDQTDHAFEDVRVCLHDGYGEVSGTIDFVAGINLKVRIKGTMDLSGDHPQPKVDKIRIGSLPGFTDWLTGGIADATIGALIEEGLEDDIHLSHSYTTEIREGEVRVDGTP